MIESNGISTSLQHDFMVNLSEPVHKKYVTDRVLSQLMDISNLTHIMDTMLFNHCEFVQEQCFETVI